MMQASDFWAAMLVQLGDPAGDRFGSGLLEEALRQGLAEYSRAAPRLLSGMLVLPAAGQWQSLGCLNGVQEVVELVFPYDPSALLYRPYAQPWQFSWRDGVPLLWIGGQPQPQAGQALQVLYTSAHTIAGLNGAAATTLPAEHEAFLVGGAAAWAAHGRALRLVEVHGSRTDEAGKWLACAAPLQQRYRAFLDSLRASGRVCPPAWQLTQRWRLDGWDV